MSKLVTILTIGFVLTSCSSVQSRKEEEYVESRARARELQDEINIGRTMAAKLMGHFKPYKGEIDLLFYLNRVGRNLTEKIGRPELTYYFGILNDPQVNAFATPGGYVFVTTGLLRQIENESQLAAILGHEIAHINERHMYYELRPRRTVGVEESFARAIGRGNSELGKSVTSAVSQGMEILLRKGIDETKEIEADQAGLYYAAQAGYDPSEFVTLIESIHGHRAKLKLASTAGDQSIRAERLRKALAQVKAQANQAADRSVLSSRYRRAIASLK